MGLPARLMEVEWLMHDGESDRRRVPRVPTPMARDGPVHSWEMVVYTGLGFKPCVGACCVHGCVGR